MVLESDLKAKRIVLESTVSPQRLIRHPDDLKKYKKVLEEGENVEIDEMIGLDQNHGKDDWMKEKLKKWKKKKKKKRKKKR